MIPGSNHHLPFNSHHHSQQHHPHHLMSPPHNQGPLAVDLNNNSLHMYNQPSLMLATPMNPGHAMALSPPQQQPLASHSSASSEAGPADSESTSPTDCSSSGGESTLSSNHSGSNSNLATTNDPGSIYNGTTTDYNGGSQQATTFYHQNGIITAQMMDQKMGGTPMSVNSQYVSLFIV